MVVPSRGWGGAVDVGQRGSLGTALVLSMSHANLAIRCQGQSQGEDLVEREYDLLDVGCIRQSHSANLVASPWPSL